MRALALLLVTSAALLTAAETTYAFPIGQPRFYAYDLRQEVAWSSAGDDLTYVTTMRWQLALRPVAVDGTTATVNATIIRIQAQHNGPGASHAVDTGASDGVRDPIFGAVGALAGHTLTLTIDQTTGRVQQATGGDAIIAAINAAHPAAIPGEPPPMDAAARALYAPEALARWWTQLLALPSTDVEPLPLAPPLTGALERRWTGTSATISLPTGVDALPVQLGGEPYSVRGTLTAVEGSSEITIDQGALGSSSGALAFDLVLDALTQPVRQRHRLQWSLGPLAPGDVTP